MTTYSIPNPYGVYNINESESYRVGNDRQWVEIFILQIECGWIVASSMKLRQGEWTGPLAKRNGVYKSHAEAFHVELRKIRRLGGSSWEGRLLEKFMKSKQSDLFTHIAGGNDDQRISRHR